MFKEFRQTEFRAMGYWKFAHRILGFTRPSYHSLTNETIFELPFHKTSAPSRLNWNRSLRGGENTVLFIPGALFSLFKWGDCSTY